jgi:hypothetical protein
MKFSRLGRIFSFLFLGLASIATLIALFGSGGFEGVFLLALGLPWTLLFEPLVESLGYVEWYGRFSGSIDTVFLYSLFATLGLLPGVLINASILHGIGALFDRASQQGGAGSPTTSSPRAPTGHAWRTAGR